MSTDILYKITATPETSAGIVVKLAPISDEEGAENQEFLVSRDSFIKLGYAIGDTVGKPEFEALSRAALMVRAISRTLKILSYSDHSRNALLRKLADYGFDGEIAAEAADYAEKNGYINEVEQACRSATVFVKNKYWGKKRIAAELLSRGYSKVAVLKAAASIPEETYMGALKKLMQRKYSPIPTEEKARAAMFSSFARLGYSLSEIEQCAKELSCE